MKTLTDIAKQALELPPVKRRILARMLLELGENDEDFSPETEAAWDEEISRRMQAVKAGRARSRTCEEVFADLDRRFAR